MVRNGAEGRLTLYIHPDKYENLSRELNDRLQVGDHLEVPLAMNNACCVHARTINP